MYTSFTLVWNDTEEEQMIYFVFKTLKWDDVSFICAWLNSDMIIVVDFQIEISQHVLKVYVIDI